MTNQLNVIAPYWCNSTQTWVFDDEGVSLEREPFVVGVPEMINKLVEDAGIENAREGFRMVFSAGRFLGLIQLDKQREEDGGCWYRSPKFELEGWLCPAMFRYFSEALEQIFVKAEPLADGHTPKS